MHLISLDLHSPICSCRLKFSPAGCKVACMMALIWCYSIQLKQPYYTWLQNPNGAHTMLTLISKIFPLHGTFHPFSSLENHLLILRAHLEWYPSTHTPGLSLQRLSARLSGNIVISQQIMSSLKTGTTAPSLLDCQHQAWVMLISEWAKESLCQHRGLPWHLNAWSRVSS